MAQSEVVGLRAETYVYLVDLGRGSRGAPVPRGNRRDPATVGLGRINRGPTMSAGQMST
jgi:hypothetical protein